jgi:hypothetical protein
MSLIAIRSANIKSWPEALRSTPTLSEQKRVGRLWSCSVIVAGDVSMRPLIRRAKLILLIAAAVAGCSRSENRYLRREVRPEEVVGRWTLSPDSAQTITNNGYSGSIDPSQLNIDIRADGTCHFHTFTSVIRSGVPPSGPVNAECRWRIDRSERPELGIFLQVTPPEATQLLFRRRGYSVALAIWRRSRCLEIC